MRPDADQLPRAEQDLPDVLHLGHSRPDLLPAGTFKDKIVLIGATAIGIYDLRVTPFSPNMAGIEKHASVVDNILRGTSSTRTRVSVDTP